MSGWVMHTYGNLEYTKDEIDVEGASTSSYIHPYGYRATLCAAYAGPTIL